ncbi:MAG: HsdM family class I SAM-dependent methyltransferase [Bacteroidales bacterium]
MTSYNLKSIKKDFKEKGIFYTPKELVSLMHKYIDIKPTTVYDPTCGDGALLSLGDEVKKFGQEINEPQIEVAKQRLTNFTGVCGDTLKEPAFLGTKFDLILANPPFSVKWEPKMDERFSQAPALAPPSKADYAFILHCIHYMNEEGMAIVLNFPGIAYRGNSEKKIRQFLIEKNLIERVVLIPQGFFVDTNIATLLIVFRKNKKTDSIIFEDLEKNKTLEVSFDTIKENDFDLSVSRYIFEEKKADPIDSLDLEKEAFKCFTKHIRAQLNFAKSVCELEQTDFNVYLDFLDNIRKEFYEEPK